MNTALCVLCSGSAVPESELVFEKIYLLRKRFVASYMITSKWLLSRVGAEMIQEIILFMRNPITVIITALENLDSPFSQRVFILVNYELVSIRHEFVKAIIPISEIPALIYLYFGVAADLTSYYFIFYFRFSINFMTFVDTMHASSGGVF